MPTKLLELIMKPGAKFWQVLLLIIGTIAVLYGKDLLEIAREERVIEARKRAELEILAARRKTDSLQNVLLGIQRAKEAEASINALVSAEELTDRLAIDIKAFRVHVIKVHNHVALENGEIPDMSIYTEGTLLTSTPAIRQEWEEAPMPFGFIKHISTMLPAKGEYVSPYNRYRYVPDILLDSGYLAGEVSRSILIDIGHRSVVTFWITTTQKGEIFFLNVAYNYADPIEKLPFQSSATVAKIRSTARSIAKLLEGL